MFNFLNLKLSPKIICRSPAMDNYEIDNLISDKYIERSRGFIAYSSIKPPVEIEVEFICPVNISYITLNTTVGSQKCTGIEIFARNSSVNYTSICKSVYDNPGIVFCNSKMYSKNNLPPNFNANYHLAFFKCNTFNCFLNASAIKITIFRTEKSVPCLGSVEVWGTTSRACSTVTKETICRIMQKSDQDTTNTALNDKTVEFKIPEDFKDDLTYEIMSIPMTLPSGKTVDQKTLEKHINSEISFGRKPCDPFTGIKFSNTLKPVLNVALKSRIDMFLLQNTHIQELPRVKPILGGGKQGSSYSNGCNKRKRETVDEIDELISKAKESPCFLNFNNENGHKNLCSKCKLETDAIYKIPCQHLYCRTCVLIICQDLKCSTCDNSFKKNDVSKCNF